jgi:hypothetical protein
MKRIFIGMFFFDAAAGEGGKGGSEELAILKQVDQKVDQIKKDHEKEISELKAAKTEVETKYKEYEQKVSDLNKELGEKGATLGQIQQEVAELKMKSGRMSVDVPEKHQSMQGLMLKEWDKATESIKNFRMDVHHQNNSQPILQTKAVGTMTNANNITGVSINGIPTISNEFAVRGRMKVHARDIFRTVDTTTGIFLFLRQNIPAGEGSVALTAGPGEVKPKRDYDNTMVTVTSKYRAGTTDIAAEMQQDIPGMGEYITQELTEDYLRTETFDFLTTLVNTATGSAALPGGVTVPAEKVAHYVANLEQNDYDPDFLLVRPRQWAVLLNTKPSDYSTPGGFVITPAGDIIFAGLRLLKTSTNAISDSEIIVGDSRRAIITQKSGEGFRVEMFKSHDKYVYANTITFRGEARAEIAVLRPDAFLKGTM